MFGSDQYAIFTVSDVGDLPEAFARGEVATGSGTGQLQIRGVEVPLSQFEIKSEYIPGLPIGMELTDIWVFSPEESAELEIHRVEFLPKEVGQ